MNLQDFFEQDWQFGIFSKKIRIRQKILQVIDFYKYKKINEKIKCAHLAKIFQYKNFKRGILNVSEHAGSESQSQSAKSNFLQNAKICISDENRTDDFNFVKTKNIML